MNARFLLPFSVISILLSCTGCPPVLIDDDQIISCDLVLSAPAADEVLLRIVTQGSVAFINEWEFNSIAAFDLENGELLWRKHNVDAVNIDWSKHMSWTSLCPVGNVVWCLAKGTTGSYAFSLSIEDGSLVKAVKFACPAEWRIVSAQCFERDGFIYFTDTNGLSRFDPSAGEEVDAEAHFFSLMPEEVFAYPVEGQAVVDFKIYGDEVIMDWQRIIQDVGGEYGIWKYSLATESLCWEVKDVAFADKFIKVGNELVASAADYQGSNGTTWVSGPYSWDWESGELLHSMDVPDQGSTTPPTYSAEENAFFTGTMAVNPDLQAPSLFCFDADTWKIRWQRPFTVITHGTNPQVKDGIMYHVTPYGLSLYDANTGRLLGTDPDIISDQYSIDLTVRHEDLMLIKNGYTFYAVKMNWKLVNGKLVKE